MVCRPTTRRCSFSVMRMETCLCASAQESCSTTFASDIAFNAFLKVKSHLSRESFDGHSGNSVPAVSRGTVPTPLARSYLMPDSERLRFDMLAS